MQLGINGRNDQSVVLNKKVQSQEADIESFGITIEMLEAKLEAKDAEIYELTSKHAEDLEDMKATHTIAINKLQKELATSNENIARLQRRITASTITAQPAAGSI